MTEQEHKAFRAIEAENTRLQGWIRKQDVELSDLHAKLAKAQKNGKRLDWLCAHGYLGEPRLACALDIWRRLGSEEVKDAIDVTMEGEG